jgi:hypothetical protein
MPAQSNQQEQLPLQKLLQGCLTVWGPLLLLLLLLYPP